MRFPEYSAKNLNGEMVHMPDDFTGDVNVIFVAYMQWHQRDVDSWLPFVAQLQNDYPTLQQYELPVVGEMNWMNQQRLDNIMRAGIPNTDTRAVTLTIYQSRTEFNRKAGLDSTEHIHVLLLDKQGNIVWKTSGGYNDEAAAELRHQITQLLPTLV